MADNTYVRAAIMLDRYPFSSEDLASVLDISVGYADNLRCYYRQFGCAEAMQSKSNEASRISKAKNRAKLNAA